MEFSFYDSGCFNKVTANEATIKTLICQTRTTSKRDIAYHVKLHDPSQYGKFKEGDVVVFLKTDDDDSAIELLNSENRGKATLAGVISRSYFLEGAFPRADETRKYNNLFFYLSGGTRWGQRGDGFVGEGLPPPLI